MRIKEVSAKSCMTKSKLSDYVINPYGGCQHSCVYCYATFMLKYLKEEKWGDFVNVKINCPELLEKELEKNKPGHIWLSSVTDPYQPLEEKYKLTRKILETIAKSRCKDKFKIEILTKSALIRRDFDLIKELNAELGMSISLLDEEISKILEPCASPPQERIQTLHEAKEKGIKVYAFISPVIAGLTNLEELFKKLSFCDYCWIEILNKRGDVIKKLLPIIKEKLPEKLKDFEYMLENYEDFCEKMKKEAKKLEKEYGLKIKEVVVH